MGTIEALDARLSELRRQPLSDDGEGDDNVAQECQAALQRLELEVAEIAAGVQAFQDFVSAPGVLGSAKPRFSVAIEESWSDLGYPAVAVALRAPDLLIAFGLWIDLGEGKMRTDLDVDWVVDLVVHEYPIGITAPAGFLDELVRRRGVPHELARCSAAAFGRQTLFDTIGRTLGDLAFKASVDSSAFKLR